MGVDKIRDKLGSVDVGGQTMDLSASEIKQFGSANDILIRVTESASDTDIADGIKGALKAGFPGSVDDTEWVRRQEKVGPVRDDPIDPEVDQPRHHLRVIHGPRDDTHPRPVEGRNAAFSRLWLHEASRVFCDRLINSDDKMWYQTLTSGLMKQKMRYDGDIEALFNESPPIFTDCLRPGVDVRVYEECADLARLANRARLGGFARRAAPFRPPESVSGAPAFPAAPLGAHRYAANRVRGSNIILYWVI